MRTSYSVLGTRKMHVMRGRPESAERHGAGYVARCTVERLMGDLGLRGVRRARSPRTTRSAPREQYPADLVKRHFEAFAPDELWVADIPPQAGNAPSYVRAFSGWVYVAFVTDVYSRRLIGWQTSTSLCTDLALDALQMAVWQRKRQGADLTGLVHHLRPWGAVQVYSLRSGSGRLRGGRLGGVEGRLLLALLWPRRSTRCTRPSSSATKDPGRTSTPPVVATAEWVHWFTTTRPHSAIGMRTPAEHEAAWAPDCHRQEQSQPATTGTR
ncbi:DDE-type integrase/transposase/recombinase [Actinomyces naeslundii]|uniref:DDE-type integrase/transposase/recombinase n=1 Tax=Actinomyces naeslundii TaxID=1655 RepID=UPI0013014D45|nr:DDE-type integrase/transposase/recombinase [Actinomyces naeslundii]QQC21068.1 DDE-type integrase/transposase/recombinase [Actinomyces naeslundii]